MPPFNDTVFLSPYAPIPDHERPLGRDEDLQDLARRLQEAGQLVVVKGLGGIGKSTLARYFVDTHRQHYRHIAWVKVNNGLPAGFSQDTYLHGKLNLDLSQIPHEYDRFTACLNVLEKLEGPNLLVLDNAVQDAAAQNYRSLLPKAPRWQVLLTSRHELNGYSKMELGKLSKDAARKLFERCYQKPVADETWKELYALTDGHALSLELFGKSLHKTLGRLGPEGLVQRLKEKKLDDPVLQQRIASEHSGDETTVYEHLLITFNLSEFGDYTIWLFKQFVALPLLSHRFDDLVALLQIDEEGKGDLHSALLFMEETGWLQREGDGFLMHPMVREVGYYRLRLTDDDVVVLVNSVMTFLELDQAKDNPVDKFYFIPYGDAILSNVNWKNKEAEQELQNNIGLVYMLMGKYAEARALLEKALVGGLKIYGENNIEVATTQNNLGLVNRELGEYKKALKVIQIALATDVTFFGEDSPKISRSQNNLALVYWDLGEYEKARDLFELVLAREIEYLGEGHPSVARCQNNLANVYRDLGEFQKACFLLEQALISDIQNFGEFHPFVAICRSNLACVYRDLGNYMKARILFEQTLVSTQRNYGDLHPDIAINRNNLALTYIDLGEYKQALDLLKLALATGIEQFGEINPNTATRYNNLGHLYRVQSQWHKAIEYFQKAYDIRLQTLGESHHNTKDAKQSLAFAQSQLSKPTLPKSQLRKKFTKPRLKK